MSKDIDFKFKLHPLTGDLIIKKNEDAIKQSLRSIVMSSVGDRRLDNSYGSGVYSLLFENLDIFSVEFFRKKLLNLIERYEPRVQIIDLQLIENLDSNTLFIQIKYTPKFGSEVQDFSVSLERVI